MPTGTATIDRVTDADRDAQDRLVRANVGLVWKMAWVCYRVGEAHPLHDEVQAAGMIGLWRAARTFNPGHPSGAKFSTYACPSIRREMQRAIEFNRRGGFTGVSRHPDVRPPCQMFDVDYASDTCAGGDLVRHLTDRREVVPGADPELPAGGDPAELAWLERSIVDLPARLGQIVRGVLAGGTYRGIGADLGVSHERVRQLYHRAVEMLTQAAEGRAVDDRRLCRGCGRCLANRPGWRYCRRPCVAPTGCFKERAIAQEAG